MHFNRETGKEPRMARRRLIAAVSTAAVALIVGLFWVSTVSAPVAPVAPRIQESVATSSTPISTTTVTTPQKPTVPTPGGYEVRMNAYTTSYTWWDNTPPGSAIIAFRKSDGFPTVHDLAGGTGTYADPITLAVGHVRNGDADTPDFAPGTRFYIPNVRAYFIVEDTCGDGDTPQNMPCHNLKNAERGAEVWLDLWIDGQSVTATEADICASTLTENHLVIKNPSSHYAVVAGPIISNGACRTEFGDTPVTQ